jgi:diguanylate cyclase (GGDEF)-like protein/PAS domain S-box-containing protein
MVITPKRQAMTNRPDKKSRRRVAEGAADLSQDVMDSFSDAVYIIDARDYRVLACNAAFLKKHELSEAQVMGRPCYELTHRLAEPCNDVFDICPLNETLKTGKHSRAEHIHFLAHGEKVYEEISTSPIFEKSGEILKVVSVARDVTARKRAEEALKRATEFSRTVMESARDAVSIVDVSDYRVLGCNAAFLKKVGFSGSEALGRPCYELTHRRDEPCTAPNDVCPLGETVRTGAHSTAEHVHYLGNGEKAFAEVSTSPVFDENGKVVKVVHVARNITERKRMHEALKRAAEFSRTVMESVGDAVSIVDVSDFRVLGANAAFLESVGLTEAEALGRPCYELTHRRCEPCAAPNHVCPLAETVRTGAHSTAEHVHYLGDGEKTFVEVSTSPVFENGKVVKVVHVARNSTERKRMEAALLESENKFRSLTEQALVGIYIIQDSVFRYLNPKFAEMFGYELPELIDRMGPKDLTCPEDWPTVEENLRRRVDREVDSIHYEFKGVTKEREIIDLEVYGSRAVFAGKPAVIGTMLDITERKRAERAIAEHSRELEKLALFDELTGLYNRRGFLDLAGKQLKTAERLGKSALLLFADLDGLKEINDRLGHQDGDAALKETANILRESCRGSDIIARLGGDEFAILALGSIHEGKKAITSRIEWNLARINGTGNRRYCLSLSAGIATFDPASPCSIDELIERADAMMYMQKSEKKRRQRLNAGDPCG